MARAQMAWGIDIGTTALKAVKLRRAGEKAVLEAFDIVEHDHFLTEPDLDIDEEIRHSLAKLIERTPLGRDPVFISDQGGSTFARFVKLPPVEPKKIPEIVRFEAIQQIPFPLDQVNWDYQVFQNPDAPDVEVGIFAMRKELVTKLLGNFHTSKLNIEGVQMTPLADYNTLMFNNMMEGKGTVVLDIGASHTDLVIVDQGRLWLRTINIGGNQFTDALAKSFKQEFRKAEKLKKTAATSKYARQIFQAMRPTFADLVQEIQRSIGYYNSSHRDSRLEQVVGMGSSFRLPNLQKFLQQYLGMPVIRLESLPNITAEGKVDASFNEQILTLPAACGLALQALEITRIDTNLLPVEIARQMLWRRKQPWFAATAALMVIGTGLVAARVLMDQSAFARTQRSPIHARDTAFINARSSVLSRYRQTSSSFKADHKKVMSYINLSRYRAVWPMLLNDVLGALPQAGKKYNPSSTTTPRNQRRVIIIEAMNSQYSPTLATAKLAAPTQQQQQSQFPNPMMGGMPGAMMPPGMPQPGGMPEPMPNLRGGPPMIPGYPVPTAPTGATTAAAPGAARGAGGFIMFIRGYTPAGPKFRREMLDQFRRALQNSAPKKGKGANKLFYIKVPPPQRAFVALTMRKLKGASNADVGQPWGLHVGPFAKVFAAQFMPPAAKHKRPGRHQRRDRRPRFPETPGFNRRGFPGRLPGGFEGGVGGGMGGGAKIPKMLDPDTHESMKNDYAFSIRFKVFLR